MLLTSMFPSASLSLPPYNQSTYPRVRIKNKWVVLKAALALCDIKK